MASNRQRQSELLSRLILPRKTKLVEKEIHHEKDEASELANQIEDPDLNYQPRHLCRRRYQESWDTKTRNLGKELDTVPNYDAYAEDVAVSQSITLSSPTSSQRSFSEFKSETSQRKMQWHNTQTSERPFNDTFAELDIISTPSGWSQPEYIPPTLHDPIVP